MSSVLQLKHTYLRVLHPLLNNTQLRHHPYKRPQLRQVLTSLISHSLYRETDPTTRRLVERNLRGSWCDGLTESSPTDDQRRLDRKSSATGEYSGGGTGWSSGMGGRRDPPASHYAMGSPGGIGGALGSPSSGQGYGREGNASTLSVDAVAREEGRRGAPRRSASGDSTTGWSGPTRQPSGSNTPLSSSVILERPESEAASTAPHYRFTSKLFATADGRHVGEPGLDEVTGKMDGLSCSPSSSVAELPGRRRRAPPPPPGSDGGMSRPRTPALGAVSVEGRGSPALGTRRPAPEPPGGYRRKVVAE